MNILLALSYYDPRLHQGIVEEAQKLSWMINAELVLSSNIPQQWDGDGIICSLENNEELNRFVLESGKPFVDLAANHSHSFPRILPSLRDGGTVAAEHFLDRSFEHFATYGQTENWWNIRCREAFTQRLRKDSKQAENWLWFNDKEKDEGSKERFEWLRNKLKEAPKPLGLYCFNDQLAQDVINLAYEEGLKIPAEIAVLGANNYELICPYLPTPLSSIDFNMKELGIQAVRRLASLIESPNERWDVQEIPLKGIVTRQSTETMAVSHPLVAQAVSYIAQHYREACSVTELARILTSSESTLRRLFKEHVGHGIKEEVQNRRMKEALKLLKEGQQIQNVVSAVGYYDSSHFSRAFKKVYGLTVKQWKSKSDL